MIDTSVVQFDFFLGIATVSLITFLIKSKFNDKHLSIEDYLSKMARINECSVYDLFFLASKQWNISKTQVEADFTDFILRGHFPFYVNDLIRRNRQALDQAKDLPLLTCFY